METNPRDSVADGWSVSCRTVDAVVGVIALLIGLVVMTNTYRLGAGWARGSPQSGYFPFRIGAIICIASAVVVVRALLRPRDGPAQIFVRWSQLRLVLAVLLPTLGYVLGIQLIGIYVASALFIAVFMRIGGGYGWAKTLLVSIGTAAMIFWLFEVEFLVPLPKGPLEALLGY